MKKFFAEFKAFAMRGNVLDMAVGVVIGGAFGKITTSIVNDIIMPLIGLLTGGIDLAKWNILLNSAAVEAGADPVTLGIGNLLAVILDFIIVAFAMFLLVKGMNKLASLKKKEEESAPEEEPKPTSEDLLTEISTADTSALEPSRAGFALSASGRPNIVFGVSNGHLAIVGINY